MDTPYLDKFIALSITRDYQRVEHGVEQHVGGHVSNAEPGGARPHPVGGIDPRYGGAPHRMMPHPGPENIRQHMEAHGGAPAHSSGRAMTDAELMAHHAGIQHAGPGKYGPSNHYHGEHVSGGGGKEHEDPVVARRRFLTDMNTSSMLPGPHGAATQAGGGHVLAHHDRTATEQRQSAVERLKGRAREGAEALARKHSPHADAVASAHSPHADAVAAQHSPHAYEAEVNRGKGVRPNTYGKGVRPSTYGKSLRPSTYGKSLRP